MPILSMMRSSPVMVLAFSNRRMMTSLETQLLVSIKNANGSGKASISGPNPAISRPTSPGNCSWKYSITARVFRQL